MIILCYTLIMNIKYESPQSGEKKNFVPNVYFERQTSKNPYAEAGKVHINDKEFSYTGKPNSRKIKDGEITVINHKEELNTKFKGELLPHFAQAIARTTLDGEEYWVLIEQFRENMNMENSIEFPAGIIDYDKDYNFKDDHLSDRQIVNKIVKNSAIREFFEETGMALHANETPIVTSFVSPGIGNERGAQVYGEAHFLTDLDDETKQDIIEEGFVSPFLDDDEKGGIKVLLVNKEKAINLLENQEKALSIRVTMFLILQYGLYDYLDDIESESEFNKNLDEIKNYPKEIDKDTILNLIKKSQ